MRLNKFLAHSGVCARRKCDELIFSGKVTINNKTVKSPWVDVNIEKDIVLVHGEIINREKMIHIVMNKPKNVLSTLKDDFKRKKVTDLINIKERIYPVGRLDYDTTGLIILTNNGDLSNRLIHPKYKVEKVYQAILKGRIDKRHILKLENGIVLDDGKKTLPAKCRILKYFKNNSIVEIIIREGRKRQVKNMFSQVGCPVLELKRVKFGPISLKGLKIGEWRYLTEYEVERLHKAAKLEM